MVSHKKTGTHARRSAKAVLNVGAPPLPTDVVRTPRELDAVVGREAFSKVEKSIRRLEAEAVVVPNADSALTAMAAFMAVDFIRSPERKQAIDKMPVSFIAKDLDVELENLAWSTWWLQSRVQSIAAIATEVRVDVELFNRGVALRTRMLRVLGYYFDDDRGMQAELADIRSGNGYQDLAVDLTRLEGHYRAHAKVLSQDTKYYDAADAESARQVANGILAELLESMQSSDETVDLRNRSWTRLSQVYATLKAASDFIFRDDPRALASFAPLRAVVQSLSTKRVHSAAQDPAPAPPPVVAPTPPAAPVPVAATPVNGVIAPTPRIPAGLPGSDPFQRS